MKLSREQKKKILYVGLLDVIKNAMAFQDYKDIVVEVVEDLLTDLKRNE